MKVAEMPIPKTKIVLSSTIAAAGGYSLLTPKAGDLTATPLGMISPNFMASVADLNGDGIADLIVGTPGSNDKAVDAGRVMVTLGAGVPGTAVDMSHGTPTTWIIDGVLAGDMAGFAVGSIADMNGDSLGEILVGAPGMKVGAANDAGTGFVIWGQTTSLAGVDLSDPFSGGGSGFAIKGQVAGDMAGYAMTSLGDVNGDGTADVLIGAPGQDAGGAEAGAAYVVWGKSSGSVVSLNNVQAGTGGFKINGAAAGDRIGETIASLADQNADGRSEILLASHTAAGGAGVVYVVDGKSTGTTVNLTDVAAGTGGYAITGLAGNGAGSSVSDAGDINDDGLHDILIGASASNAAYVVFGQSGHVGVDLGNVSAGIGGFRVQGESAGDLANMVVMGGQDLNRDGIADLVIGASHNSEGGANAGAVYVIWGGAGRSVMLSEIAQGIGGAKIVGAAGSLTGASVSFAGDLNGDGVTDLMIGAPGTGERVQVLYTPSIWMPDTNIYGTAGADIIGAGYGSTLHSIGTGNDTVLGLDGNDSISTGDGDDVLEGGAGADTLVGGAGNDLYLIDSADTIVELADLGSGNDTIQSSVNATMAANVENLVLTGSAISGTGNAGDNTITGNAKANILAGLGGADTMAGGTGDDTYYVTDATDVVVESVNAGFDTVISSINLTLKANLEALTLIGTATNGVGNTLANTLTGNALNNILNGSTGADTMIGGLGDDTYYVDNASDMIVEAVGEGNDTVLATVDFTLGAEVENLTLKGAARHATGNALANKLVGTAFDDVLDGGAGIDKMTGGNGNDTYMVDSASDAVVETATGGIDTVVASVNYTLGTNVENLILSGAAHFGKGNGLANHLTGTSLADTLDGNSGADVLEGGAGNDTFIVDNIGDSVIELAAGGVDTVRAKVSVTLGAEVENLVLTLSGLTGTGNAGDNLLTGSAGTDTLIGGDGNDVLDGAAGADRLIGGTGDDTYIVGSTTDVIIEDALGGIDTAVLMIDGLTVAANIENIRLAGTAHNATGGGTDNRIAGGAGADDLDGGGGDDVLSGGDGNDHLRAHIGHDTLIGGAGNDVYHISGATVEIEDLLGHDAVDSSDSVTDDRIDLSGETASEVEHQVVHVTPGGTTSSPLDVQFLQDLTGSFGDDIATVRGLVPQIITALQAVQSNADFGVSSFVDKPISPFGATGEWVYRQELAMTSSATSLSTTYNGMATLNGMDGPEAQIEALMQLSLHAADVGFRPDSARFVVLFTDAPFHIAGDGLAAGITTANNGDGVLNGGGIGEDYPMISQLRAALEGANIIPIFAIAGGYETTYQDLTTQLGRGAVVTLTANSSNIVSAITAGMTAATTTHIEDATSGSGNDVLLGSTDDNTLSGNLGNDSLEGRGGNDILIGGLGSDSLTGDAGADSFVFKAITESTTAAYDMIKDFVSGADHIDLSQIDANTLTAGDQAFVFIGSAAFSMSAGELNFSTPSAGLGLLQGDINGDGVADFAIGFDLLTGTAPVLADLFL